MGGPRKTRAIRAALLSKGFMADDTHHEMFWLVVDGRKSSIRTRISHGVAEYGDNLLAHCSSGWFEQQRSSTRT